MEPAVFSANSGAFWKTATRAVPGTDANLSRSDENKIAKIAKSRRAATQVEAVVERKGDGFKNCPSGPCIDVYRFLSPRIFDSSVEAGKPSIIPKSDRIGSRRADPALRGVEAILLCLNGRSVNSNVSECIPAKQIHSFTFDNLI